MVKHIQDNSKDWFKTKISSKVKKKMLFLKDHDKNLSLNKAMKLRLYD